MKTTEIILSTLLAASLIGTYIFYREAEECKSSLAVPPTEPVCPEIKGYAGPLLIDSAAARSCINQYKAFIDSRLSDEKNNGRYGGVISGAAIDSIFKVSGTNGLGFYLAIDTTGEFKKDKSIFVVFGGQKSTLDADGIFKTEESGSKLYENNNWCPPDCAEFKYY